ncbi:hypothetical protein Dcar01_01836 [Deinococcus carri]|uniref:Bacteriophage T5 Orf172 DNA-binding domain-containing protein n=2 Tax=Deinococcus carri TaxID=1211323 RepID=A0ABP9W9F3_9DEIO
MRSPALREGLYKIGLTAASHPEATDALKRRARELNDPTGSPGGYQLVEARWSPDCKAAERWAHHLLREYRYLPGKELFWVPRPARVQAALRLAVFKAEQRQPLPQRKLRARKSVTVHYRQGVGFWDRPPAGLDSYMEGCQLLPLFPRRGEAFLRRAGGMLLPPELVSEAPFVPALRLLGEHYARGAWMDVTAPNVRVGPGESPLLLPAWLLCRPAPAARTWLKAAAAQGDWLAHGRLAQLELATSRPEAAQIHQAQAHLTVFGVGLVEALARANGELDEVCSPLDAGAFRREDGRTAWRILVTWASQIKRGQMAPPDPSLRRQLKRELAQHLEERWVPLAQRDVLMAVLDQQL